MFLLLIIGRDMKRRKHQLDQPGLQILCPPSREEVQVEVRWEQGGAKKQVRGRNTTGEQEAERNYKTPRDRTTK